MIDENDLGSSGSRVFFSLCASFQDFLGSILQLCHINSLSIVWLVNDSEISPYLSVKFFSNLQIASSLSPELSSM